MKLATDAHLPVSALQQSDDATFLRIYETNPFQQWILRLTCRNRTHAREHVHRAGQHPDKAAIDANPQWRCPPGRKDDLLRIYQTNPTHQWNLRLTVRKWNPMARGHLNPARQHPGTLDCTHKYLTSTNSYFMLDSVRGAKSPQDLSNKELSNHVSQPLRPACQSPRV